MPEGCFGYTGSFYICQCLAAAERERNQGLRVEIFPVFLRENTTRPLMEWERHTTGWSRIACPLQSGSCHTASAPGGRFPKAVPLVAPRRERNPLSLTFWGAAGCIGGLRHPLCVPCSDMFTLGKNGLLLGVFENLIIGTRYGKKRSVPIYRSYFGGLKRMCFRGLFRYV